MNRKPVMLAAAMLFLVTMESKDLVFAEEHSVTGHGAVEYTGEYPKEPVDPENPEKPVNPGPGASTDGELRFDFAPTLNFGKNKITEANRNFYVNAQLFHNGPSARGNFLQITDSRAERSGWTLQVRQEYQFKNDVIQEEKEKELRGAVLSFDKAWANSAYTQEKAPQLSKDIIQLNAQEITFPVASADQGQGKGSWIISFGASDENKHEQTPTLFPKVDEKNQPILDEQFENQQVYGNKAIFLSVPDTVTIHPVQYQTELTWILAELP
ncbi:WxL domain-containing protein [Candidatus Enterococcus mansonii]|uniref:WxL domain-containing protein n=1 Tax=Candidatus Enterococcus mansonii TaxID=1834181 RepID=A0A242CHG1_9ENTE|nr:WxL domain-containing protein [Enterococcus sp. 4G2_DIV0659]OTO09350.1 hypothetical protein A5880_000029 [Enterococcus sp. 4G2_DIV0659]